MAKKNRAAKSAKQREGSPFQIWVTPEVRARLKAAAAKAHHTYASEWARRVLLCEADRLLDGTAA